MNRRLLERAAAGAMLLVWFLSPVRSQQCVVIVLPPCGWATVSPEVRTTLDALITAGASAGSMSCGVPQPMTEESGWVTLGAGARARWPVDLIPAESLPPDEAIRYPASALQQANEALPRGVRVGALGQALHEANLWTGLVGGAEIWHEAAVIDDSGQIDVTLEAATPPGVEAAIGQADLLVVNARAVGDGEEIAASIEGVSAVLDEELDLLIVTALAPEEAPFVGLAPIVIRGPGFTGGSVTSSTTGRPGVVASIDLAPTVLESFGLEGSVDGSAMSADEEAFDLEDAIALDRAGRHGVAAGAGALPTALALLAAHLIVALGAARHEVLRPMARGGLLASVALPALLCSGAPVWGWVLPVIPAYLCGFFIRRRRQVAWTVFAFSAAAAMLLIVDAIAGAPAQPFTPLGYRLGLGERFHGIGDASAGALIAASAVAAGIGPLASRSRGLHWCAVLALVGVVVVTGHGSSGANPSGAIGAAICFAALVAQRWWRHDWAIMRLGPLRALRDVCDRLPGSGGTLVAIGVGGLAVALLNDTPIAALLMMLAVALSVLGLAASADDPSPPKEEPEADE